MMLAVSCLDESFAKRLDSPVVQSNTQAQKVVLSPLSVVNRSPSGVTWRTHAVSTGSFAESERNSGSGEMNADSRDTSTTGSYSEGQRMASSVGILTGRRRNGGGPILGLPVSLRRVSSWRGDSVTGSDEIEPVGQSQISEAEDYSLSVVMPVHNEERTIEQAVAEILEMKLGHRFELIVVDDGSLDRTPDLLQRIDDPRVSLRRHDTNLRKGAAVLNGATLATGSHMVVFDADHEYRACDLARMFEPIVEGRAEVVFGTRVFGINTLFPSFSYALGNRVTTFAANVLLAHTSPIFTLV